MRTPPTFENNLSKVWENNPGDVIVMSSRLFDLGFETKKFITVRVRYKPEAWSLKLIYLSIYLSIYLKNNNETGQQEDNSAMVQSAKSTGINIWLMLHVTLYTWSRWIWQYMHVYNIFHNYDMYI